MNTLYNPALFHLSQFDDTVFLSDDSSQRSTKSIHQAEEPLDGSANTAYVPRIVPPINISALTKPDRYPDYIATYLPSRPLEATLSHVLVSELVEKLCNPVGDTYWIRNCLFRGFETDPLRRPNSVWDWKAARFKKPPSGLAEGDIKDFFNETICNLGHIYNVFDNNAAVQEPWCNRLWDDKTQNSPIQGGSTRHIPDLCLLAKMVRTRYESEHEEQSIWSIVQAIAEITNSKVNSTCTSKINRTIEEKASLIFKFQPHRRFVIGLAIYGPIQDPKWSLTLFDRAGAIQAGTFDLSGSGGIALIIVLFNLAFGDPDKIGVDLTMDVNQKSGDLSAISVSQISNSLPILSRASQSFDVIRLLHSPKSMTGRTARVWLVNENGQFYILKDSWALENQPFSEITTLAEINDLIHQDAEASRLLRHCYPVYIAGQDLGDSTDDRRAELPSMLPSRVHRRLVTGPVGDPLTTFRSKRELCSCLRDVIRYLQFLSNNGYVHGDISLNNILINRIWREDYPDCDCIACNENKQGTEVTPMSCDPSPDESEPAEEGLTRIANPPNDVKAFGLTIDNDHTFKKTQGKDFSINVGTVPFMSIEALRRKEGFCHTERDDLESVLYVLLTVCSYMEKPGVLRAPLATEPSIPMTNWFLQHNEQHWNALAREKAVCLESFEELVGSRLSSYWNDFVPYLQRLLNSCWPEVVPIIRQANVATHETFLEILEDALKDFADEEVYPYAAVMDPVAIVGNKRYHDREEPSGQPRKRPRYALY